MSALTKEQILEAIRAQGVRSKDFRDAVHEATHALYCGAGDWSDREDINDAVERACANRSDLVAEEMQARATEWEACEQFGVPYELETWAAIALLEAIKYAHISLDLDSWMTGITHAKETGIGRKRFEALLAHLGLTFDRSAE